MLEKGYNLGGEQSGHIIFLDDATTGDGQLAAVKFLSILSSCGRKVSELVGEIPSFPQVLKNVPIAGGNAAKEAVMANSLLLERIAGLEDKLAGKGRVLVRPSGTEPLIRVMIEAETDETAERCAVLLTALIEELAG